jgi:tetratricopeptide (TPR) repeat protein
MNYFEFIFILLFFIIIFSENIGKIFYYKEKWSISLFFFKINPFHNISKLNFIANCYAELGDNIKAIEIYNKILKKDDGYDIHQNIGLSYIDIGLYDDAYNHFEKAYKDKYIKNFNPENSYTTKYKIRHDIEQIEYLIKNNILDDNFNKQINDYKILESEIDSSYDFYYYFDNKINYDKKLLHIPIKL